MASMEFPHEQETDQILYHYTTLETLFSMLQSVKVYPPKFKGEKEFTTFLLRGTSVLYLNDTQELFQCLTIAKQRVEEYKLYGDTVQRQAYMKAVEQVEQQYQNVEYQNLPFVTCFSEEKDSNPLWQQYAPDGNGIAIGIKVSTLNRYTKPTKNPREKSVARLDNALIKCVYNAKLMDETFQFQLNRSVTLEKNYARQHGKWSTLFEYHLNTFSLKHPSFAYEKEHRLLYKRNPSLGPVYKLQHEIRNGLLTPYIEHQLPVSAIEEIVLGPSKVNRGLQKRALEQCLTTANFPINAEGKLKVKLVESECK